MPSPEGTSVEERNKTLIKSFIEEIFNEHNLSSVDKYFGKEISWEGRQMVETIFDGLHLCVS